MLAGRLRSAAFRCAGTAGIKEMFGAAKNVSFLKASPALLVFGMTASEATEGGVLVRSDAPADAGLVLLLAVSAE